MAATTGTSIEEIDAAIDNIYGTLQKMDFNLTNIANIDQGPNSPIAQRSTLRTRAQTIFRLDPIYTTLAAPIGTQPPAITQPIATFTLGETPTQPTLLTRELQAPTLEPVITPPTQPPADTQLLPETKEALQLAYTADQLLLIQQENELLLAILTILQELKNSGFGVNLMKEFPGFTPTGLKTYFHSSETVPASLSRFHRTAAIPYPFVIRHIYATAQVYADIIVPEFNIGVEEPGQTKNSTTNLIRPIWKLTTTFRQLPMGALGQFNLPINHLVPEPNKAIYWELHNGQAVDSECGALIIIEALTPDSETLNIS